jgi:hypothetical protein
MIFMHAILLTLIVIVGIFATAIAWAFSSMDETKKTLPIVFTFFTLLCGIWLFGSASMPYKIDYSVVLPVKTVDGPYGPTQVVVYEWDDELKVLNVNKHFGCHLPENAKVRWTVYRNGPYCGVSYSGMPDVTKKLHVFTIAK